MSVFRAYRSLFADRALIRLLVGEFVSSIGDWLYLVALLVVVYDRSNDTVLLGIVGAARILPYIVLSVPAGIAADRFDRRLVLLSTDVARGAIMLGLAALVAVDGPLWAIVGLAILATCFSAFFGPTIGSYLPTLVGDESRLGPANSAWASLDNLAFIVGPAIGGLLIAASGLTLAFLLNAISFAFVAVVLWQLPPSRGSSRAAAAESSSQPAAGATAGEAGPWAPTAAAVPSDATTPSDAIAPMAKTIVPPSIRAPVIGLGVLNVVSGFAFGGLSVLTVVLASQTFSAGEEATGYLNAAIGVGGLIGAIVSGALVLRPRLGPSLVGGAALLGAGLAGLGIVGSLAPALVAMTVASAGSLLTEVVGATIFQRVVPDQLRGRALGAIAAVANVAYAAGSFAVPVLAGTIGTLPVLVGAGLAVAASAIVTLVLVGAAATRHAAPNDELLRHIAGLPVFTGVPPSRLEAILARHSLRDVPAGSVVIRQGDPPDRFAVIVDGRFAVARRETPDAKEQHLRTLTTDDVFGEIGLLTGVPRTATVRAETDGRLCELDGQDFLELVVAGPGLASRLLDIHGGSRVAVVR